MRTVAFVALMGCLLSWTAVASAQERIPWVADWREARTMAQDQHRLVLLHFYSDQCAPCMKLERDVFPRPEVARALSTGYVPVKINVDRFPQLRDHYKVEAWPTDVIVTAAGKEVARSVPSPADANRYIAMLDSARAQYGIGSHEQLAGPQQVTPPSSNLPQSRYGTGGFGGNAATNATSTSSGYGDPRGGDFAAQTAAPQQPSVVRNQYAGEFAAQPPAPANPAPRYGDQYSGSAPAQPAAGAEQAPYGQQTPYAQQVPYGQQAPSAQQNPYGQPPQGVANAQSGRGDFAVNPYGDQQTAPSGPANNPRVASNPNQLQTNQPSQPSAGGAPSQAESQFAMDGFCPVTLVVQQKWQKGDTRWGAVHLGKTYLFASQQGQQQFLASPEQYAPILSGFDPVRYTETGQLVDGRREHGVFYGNRIFLFADEVALDRFSKNTDFYMARVRQASATTPGQPARR